MTKNAAQRRRWTFYEAITLKNTLIFFPIQYICDSSGKVILHMGLYHCCSKNLGSIPIYEIICNDLLSIPGRVLNRDSTFVYKALDIHIPSTIFCKVDLKIL